MICVRETLASDWLASHMDMLHIFLLALWGVVSCSNVSISGSGSVSEVSVRPGDNITLYCDCRLSSGVYIVWYRNFSHENQPALVLNTRYNPQSSFKQNFNPLKPIPRFELVRNFSSDSYDLLITKITESDEGLYYCGTEKSKVEEEEFITQRHLYRYSNITTKIIINLDPDEPRHANPPDCGICWSLLFSVCPAVAVLSSLFSLLVYHLRQKKARKPQVDQPRSQIQLKQDEDVCYAALEIRQPSQRPTKKKKTQSSDFSTYAAIKTSRM